MAVLAVSAVLGGDYRKSGDVAWTTSGDAQGFHVMTARESEGYAGKTTASLTEPGFDADQWIGNACVTASGDHTVVVYAPRTFTNERTARGAGRGGFTAVVELASGSVTKLPLMTSLSYYNPGCGADKTAVLTQSMGEDRAAPSIAWANQGMVDVFTRTTISVPWETRATAASSLRMRAPQG
ncbi:hypothetical protein [Streptomyces cyaneofuscatus]|uniref:hypothetical protein n=1 Tax=Streptomyces cyaneofuscatus TaxID=66883 RepID=UPI003F53F2FA